MIWRVYCGKREFGVDYPSREAAEAVAAKWRRAWPKHTYWVRRYR